VITVEMRDENAVDNGWGNISKDKLSLSTFSWIKKKAFSIPTK
jgi:hypothetical protein